MTVVDAHTHIYPDKISRRAVKAVGEFYGVEMNASDASAQAALHKIGESPITHQFVYSVATTAHQVENINNFIAEQCATHPSFIGFATMHQDYEDMEGEIERAIKLGLRGVKIHPDSQEVAMDDPRMMRLYEIIEGRLPIVIHCGDYRYQYSHPRRLRTILHTFPNLKVNAAHFGGWSVFSIALEYLEHENCFLDTSSSLEFLGSKRTVDLVRRYGSERVMFGSDFPMWHPVTEYRMLSAMDFTHEEFENLTHRTAERFLGEPIV